MAITKLQEEILYLLTVKFKTPKQIASKRNTTVWAVYKIMSKLQEKGLVKKGYKLTGTKPGGYKTSIYKRGTPKSYEKLLRLHNIQISIRILNKGKSYLRLLRGKNKEEISGSTIILYENYVEVYTQEGLSFTGYTTNQCYDKAINYFSMLYSKLENDLKIIIDKDRYLNKKWVRQHIAEIGNEIAKKANKDKERLVLKDREDNKIAVITDNSFKLDELEFTHPIKAKTDADKVLRHIQDMRENGDTLTLSQISLLVKDLFSLQKEQAAGLLSIIDLIKPKTVENGNNAENGKIKTMPNYIG